MFEGNYANLLQQITIQAIAKLTGHDSNISNLLYALTNAVSTRQIVGCVQFEEAWQSQIDDSNTWYVSYSLKVAPELCAIAYRNGDELNEEHWDFAIPNINMLEVSAMPRNVIDYLAMGKVMVDIEDDESYRYNCLNNALASRSH